MKQLTVNASPTYSGMYHALSVASYAEDVFAEAVEWIEEQNRLHPEDQLTVSRGLLRLVEMGLGS